MAISDDWTIYYNLKKIEHTSGTTVYTANELYSWLMDTFDELVNMDDPNPMTAQTPTEYTLVNGWFIPYSSFEYLKGGAIKTSGWDADTYDDGIRILEFESSGYTDCVATDIGKTVTGGSSGTTGILLDYDNTNRKWWVRMSSTSDDYTGGESITISGGTGAGTLVAGGTKTGENLWVNVYTLGSIESDTLIYIIQGTNHISEWWSTGHIDILLLVKEAGTLIASGYVTVFARQYTKTYDHFGIDLSSGGRNAVPLATQNDLNNQTDETTVSGYNDIQIVQVNGTLSYTGASGGPFQKWETITGGTSGHTAVVLNDSEDGTLVVGNATGLFQSGETITGGDSGATATLSSTLDVSTTTFNEDLNNGNGPRPYDIHINCAGRPLSEVYEYFKYITKRGSTFIFYQNDGSSLTQVEGERYISAQSSYTPVKQSPLGTYAGGTYFGAQGVWIENYDSADAKNFQLIDSTGTTQVPPNVVSVKVTSVVAGDRVAVFRLTAAGGSIDKQRYTLDFGSVGYSYSYNADTDTYTDETSDINNSTVDDVALPPMQTTTVGDAIYIGHSKYKFDTIKINVSTAGVYSGITLEWQYYNGSSWTALSGVNDGTNGFQNSGTNNISFTVPGDWAKTDVNGDNAYWVRCVVTGFSSPSITTSPLAAQAWNWYNITGNTCLYISGTIASDEPASGVVRVVLSDGTDDRYSYSSFADGYFVLSSALTSDYSEGQYVYVPIIDTEATTDYVDNTLVYSSDIPVLVRVRKYGIIPFEVESTVTSVGLTVSAIRTADNIVA